MESGRAAGTGAGRLIPTSNILDWKRVVPWTDPSQVEQDLIISRVLVELFSDPFLNEQLRFRGGTALNKLHFPAPFRYSEDIDLVRTTHGPMGPILNGIRDVLKPWLGDARFKQSRISPKLLFRMEAQDSSSSTPLSLKIEINTREIEAYGGSRHISYEVENSWFSGAAMIHTYSREEILATKLRALLQREKGRDLFDLAHALEVFDKLDIERMIEFFVSCTEKSGVSISRAEAERRMFAKINDPDLLNDIIRIVPESYAQRLTDETLSSAFLKVFHGFIEKIPGNPWKKTEKRMALLTQPEE